MLRIVRSQREGGSPIPVSAWGNTRRVRSKEGVIRTLPCTVARVWRIERRHDPEQGWAWSGVRSADLHCEHRHRAAIDALDRERHLLISPAARYHVQER